MEDKELDSSNGQAEGDTSAPNETSEKTPAQESEKPEGDKFTDQELESPDSLKGLSADDLQKKYKSFQSDYSKKTKALADQRKRTEAELNQLKAHATELSQFARDVLSDPKKIDAYKQVLGPKYGINPNVPPIPDKLETVEDLKKYLNERDQAIERKVESKLSASTVTTQLSSRWNNAITAHSSTDPVFKNEKYQKMILAIVQDPSRDYISNYRAGVWNEAEVLKRGTEEFKELVEPLMEDSKQNAMKSIADKKKASMPIGRRSEKVTTTKNDNSREAIIARVNAKLSESRR